MEEIKTEGDIKFNKIPQSNMAQSDKVVNMRRRHTMSTNTLLKPELKDMKFITGFSSLNQNDEKEKLDSMMARINNIQERDPKRFQEQRESHNNMQQDIQKVFPDRPPTIHEIDEESPDGKSYTRKESIKLALAQIQSSKDITTD